MKCDLTKRIQPFRATSIAVLPLCPLTEGGKVKVVNVAMIDAKSDDVIRVGCGRIFVQH